MNLNDDVNIGCCCYDHIETLTIIKDVTAIFSVAARTCIAWRALFTL